ncbi:MAG: hypothetical protein ACJA2M_002622 [Polaribacter sp.]|jgi:hypothetical protein
MKKIINFLKNSWTLKTVLLFTFLYLGVSMLFGKQITISEIIITFLVFLYFVWGFGKRPNKNSGKTHHNNVYKK